MFERFTKSARAVVERAMEEALVAGSDGVGSAEMLLGVATGGGRGARERWFDRGRARGLPCDAGRFPPRLHLHLPARLTNPCSPRL